MYGRGPCGVPLQVFWQGLRVVCRPTDTFPHPTETFPAPIHIHACTIYIYTYTAPYQRPTQHPTETFRRPVHIHACTIYIFYIHNTLSTPDSAPYTHMPTPYTNIPWPYEYTCMHNIHMYTHNTLSTLYSAPYTCIPTPYLYIPSPYTHTCIHNINTYTTPYRRPIQHLLCFPQSGVVLARIAQRTCRNTLHYTATHCNTLQHIATHCNTLQHTCFVFLNLALCLLKLLSGHGTAPAPNSAILHARSCCAAAADSPCFGRAVRHGLTREG